MTSGHHYMLMERSLNVRLCVQKICIAERKQIKSEFTRLSYDSWKIGKFFFFRKILTKLIPDFPFYYPLSVNEIKAKLKSLCD